MSPQFDLEALIERLAERVVAKLGFHRQQVAELEKRDGEIDLRDVPAVSWAWVDETTYAAIRGCSVKTLQKERRLNIGCPYRRINGSSIRYKMGDIAAFLESQPSGGGGSLPRKEPSRRAGRPRRSAP